MEQDRARGIESEWIQLVGVKVANVPVWASTATFDFDLDFDAYSRVDLGSLAMSHRPRVFSSGLQISLDV